MPHDNKQDKCGIGNDDARNLLQVKIPPWKPRTRPCFAEGGYYVCERRLPASKMSHY
ncbi:hypothetical protein J6590_018281 [Homalodisca vitripennis]|nr:hypothetical protein J6590_018281 [Homalodisca vitripennis]